VGTTRRLAGGVAALLGLAACASTASPSAVTSTPPLGGLPQVPSASASATPSPSATLATADPCAVLTQSEASALSKVSMPAGVSQPWGSGGGVKCGYTSGSVEAFVILLKAKSSQEAQAAWDVEKAQLQQEGTTAGVQVTATSIAGLGDQAEMFVGNVAVGGFSNTIMAVFVLKGSTFLDLGDFALKNAKAPTTDALKAQAETSTGRI